MGAAAPQAGHGAAPHQRALLPLRREQPLGQRNEKTKKITGHIILKINPAGGAAAIKAENGETERDSEKPGPIGGQDFDEGIRLIQFFHFPPERRL
jgi:hypothetical protein